MRQVAGVVGTAYLANSGLAQQHELYTAARLGRGSIGHGGGVVGGGGVGGSQRAADVVARQCGRCGGMVVLRYCGVASVVRRLRFVVGVRRSRCRSLPSIDER